MALCLAFKFLTKARSIRIRLSSEGANSREVDCEGEFTTSTGATVGYLTPWRLPIVHYCRARLCVGPRYQQLFLFGVDAVPLLDVYVTRNSAFPGCEFMGIRSSDSRIARAIAKKYKAACPLHNSFLRSFPSQRSEPIGNGLVRPSRGYLGYPRCTMCLPDGWHRAQVCTHSPFRFEAGFCKTSTRV